MVADPYFGARQILQLLDAVPRTEIDFTILSSRLAFESEHALNSDARKRDVQAPGVTSDKAPLSIHRISELERLSSFENSLATLLRRGMKTVTALVLNGRVPPLHDRFLVIDGVALFLGNSLNALGHRASLILSVPDSEPILAKLRVMASLALPFNIYASRRREVLAPHGKGG